MADQNPSLEQIITEMAKAGVSDDDIQSVADQYLKEHGQATSGTPTDIFHKGAWDNLKGMASGVGDRLGEIAKSLPLAVLDPLGTETAKITGRGETNPLKAVGNAVVDTVKEPYRIGMQAGEGTPEAIGRSVVDTAALVPAIFGVKGMSDVGGPAIAPALRATKNGIANVLDHPATASTIGAGAGLYADGLYGAAAGAMTGNHVGRPLLDAIAKFMRTEKPPVPKLADGSPVVNTGGVLRKQPIPGERVQPPPTTIESELLARMQDELRPQSVELAPSHEAGGEYTVPPNAESVNRGGRLSGGGGRVEGDEFGTARDQVFEALQSLRGNPTQAVELSPSHPVGGGYTVPPANPEGLNPNAGGLLRKPGGPTADPLAEILAQRPAAASVSLSGDTGTPSVTLSPAAQRAGRVASSTKGQALEDTMRWRSYGLDAPDVPNTHTSTSGAGGVDIDTLYRQLASKSILSPEESQILTNLRALMETRAREIGMSHAASGKVKVR